MALSHRRRCLDLIVAELAAVPRVGRTGKGEVDVSRLNPEDYPAAFVLTGFGGVVEEQSARRQRVEMPFAVIGLVNAKAHDVATILDAIEEWYQRVENVILGDTLQTALDADLSANAGAGAISVHLDSAPTDEDLWPPFGTFRLHAHAILHYARGAL